MRFKLYITFIGFLLFGYFSLSQDSIPAKPVQQRLVNDFAEILTPPEEAALEKKLLDFFVESSTQIAVVTVKGFAGYDKSDFAVRLGDKWGIGKAEHDNGVLVLVKPKYKNERGELEIAVGYGLEGAIPDITANHISDRVMIPYFKNNDMFGGLNAGADALIAAAKGEYNDQQTLQPEFSSTKFIVIGIIIFFIFLFLLANARRRRHFDMGSKGTGIPPGTLIDILNSAGKKNSGSFGDFSSGKGSFGGGSFGGFGGFGGGSFGGGGAGGSW